MKSLTRSLAFCFIVAAIAISTGCSCGTGHDKHGIKTDTESLHLKDPVAFREQAVNQKILDVFGTKPMPGQGDQPIDLMPRGTRRIALINPGFEFTYNNGEAPGANFWIIVVEEGKPGVIQDGGQNVMSDPIKGWTAYGCAGLESGRPKQWVTPPDGVTGYAISHGRDYYLHQTIPGALKPNTRYTMVVEVFKRKDYKRATADEIILQIVDGQSKPLDLKDAEYHITPASKTTGHSVCLITVTTHADQKPGDLRLHLGENAEGQVRFNVDNVMLFEQPME